MSQGPYPPPAPGQRATGGGRFTPPPAGTYGAPGGGGPRLDGLAGAGLILAIFGLVGALMNLLTGLLGTCCVVCTVGSTFIALAAAVPAVAGLVMGWISMGRTRQDPQRVSGWGLALAAAIVASGALMLCLLEVVVPWLGLGILAHSGSLHPTPAPITRPVAPP